MSETGGRGTPEVVNQLRQVCASLQVIYAGITYRRRVLEILRYVLAG